MSYTVKQLANAAGVTVRTLHYYDEIGLLKPSFLKENGYRCYEEKEVVKLQQILFFRELDFPLENIVQIINAPEYKVLEALAEQRTLLEMKRARLDGLLETIERTMKKLKEGRSMSTDELFAAFTESQIEQYKEEVKVKWGRTDAYQQSIDRSRHWTKEDFERIKEEGQAITLSLAKLMESRPGESSSDQVCRRRKKQQIHFWHSTGTRPYMQARAAIAYLLWRKLGKQQEAIDHFRALLDLNPGDNQGNRYAIICCLLEQGDDETLGEALQRYFLYTDEYGEEMDLRETCWWYTNACWKFRCASSSTPRSFHQAASKALRTAFTYNQHVPYFLLHPEALADFGEPDSYAHGDESEAAWYAGFVLKAWRQTRGALDWLEASAKRAGLPV